MKQQKRKILLADDDRDDRDVFEAFLGEREDIDILPFAIDGPGLLAYLDKSRDVQEFPDLIILDQNMPKVSGKHTLASLKASPSFSSIPVVIYSTHTDEDFIRSCIEMGAHMVVTKPLTREGYNQMMDACLRETSR